MQSKVLKPFRWRGKMLAMGDRFDVPPRYVKLLTRAKRIELTGESKDTTKVQSKPRRAAPPTPEQQLEDAITDVPKREQQEEGAAAPAVDEPRVASITSNESEAKESSIAEQATAKRGARVRKGTYRRRDMKPE